MTTGDDSGTPPGDGADHPTGESLDRLTENLATVETLTKRLVEVMSRRKPHSPSIDAPSQELFAKAASAYWTEMVHNPAKIFEHQLSFWGSSVKHFMEAQQALASGKFKAPEDPGPRDPRFKNPLWDTHPYFNFLKQQYLINAQGIRQAVEDVADLDPVEKKRLNYFAGQIVEMMSPTNFLATNPDALERAVATEGMSLVKGLENLIADLEAHDGELVVRLADDTAFEMGNNIATTPGSVVFRNRMLELIQYKPATETVKEIPLLIVPPWINKFYILDLKAQNSLIKWLTEQGYTVFVVSWVNPDENYADVGMEEYVEEGFLTAMGEVRKICGTKKLNVVGYCIAGTTLALTLSLMKKRGDDSVNSATFFTALTDFSDQGEFTPFLQNDFVDGIQGEIEKDGYLPSYLMSRTFSFLRANDLVYQPAIRNYMLGETPPAFDLLYWNGDGTNLPGKMAVQYLRQLCQGNAFSGDGLDLMGQRLHIKDMDVPLCAIACETDHIAPWKDSYRGVQMMGSNDRTFIMTQSGHIAGIVNPPSKKKYGHYINPDMTLDPDTWKDTGTFHEGSWWPTWDAWLRPQSGRDVPAREPGDSTHPVLAPAPGTYVAIKAR